MINKKEGQLRVSTILLFFLLVVAVFVAAQNLTEGDQLDSEVVDLCEDVICEDSDLECPDGFVVSCSNLCDSDSGVCSECELGCSGHEVVLPEESLNESVVLIPEENVTLFANETVDEVPVLPEGLNETSNETVSNFSDVVPEYDSGSAAGVGLISESGFSDVDVQLFYPDEITRGDDVELKVVVTNKGGAIVTNVLVELQLPLEFEIISWDKEKDCGDLVGGETCEMFVGVRSSVSAFLGVNEIKILVGYDE
jgi:uncharacterized repeat protein (TIGR01451 family)